MSDKYARIDPWYDAVQGITRGLREPAHWMIHLDAGITGLRYNPTSAGGVKSVHELYRKLVDAEERIKKALEDLRALGERKF